VGRLWNKQVPHKFDTDVNAPALSEYMSTGKPRGQSSAVYITVGTGVGGGCSMEGLAPGCILTVGNVVGLVVNGLSVHGLLHPEGGHMMLRRYRL